MKAPLGFRYFEPGSLAVSSTLVEALIDAAQAVTIARTKGLSPYHIAQCEVYLAYLQEAILKRMPDVVKE